VIALAILFGRRLLRRLILPALFGLAALAG
jgi:hypothetical protein